MARALPEQLQRWLHAREDEHLEFKEAKGSFEFEELAKYCAALANEGGGAMVLGVTDRRPRRVVGSQAFRELERTKVGLAARLGVRVEVDEVGHRDGRVLVFRVPARPRGRPVESKGAYWMRVGQSLVPMTADQLKRIFDEIALADFSAEVCAGASFTDLDARAIGTFRSMWAERSDNSRLQHMSDEELLAAAELTNESGITYAALVLFGTHRALGRHLAQSEVVFEYRSSEGSIPHQQRKEYRLGFFLWFDELWQTIDLRNDVQDYFEGPYRREVRTLNEVVVREAILNAVSHRDYRAPGSTFVRQFPRKLELVSPGGFPHGVTPENVLYKHQPRNRRIAESFARCGLVERAGQGMNRMYEGCIRESKAQPDFTRTDAFEVWLTLPGEIRDPQFVRFLEQVTKERETPFTTEDLLALDAVHSEREVPATAQSYLAALLEDGIIEGVGRGRGARYMLSRRFYSFIGKPGVYTRRRGLDRETNKELLLRHVRDSGTGGSRLEELMQVLPALSRDQVRWLLQSLRSEGRIESRGHTSAGRWYAASLT